MAYLGEMRQNIRPLLAASIGTGTSLPLFAYTNSVFSPFLIKEFGWSRSQFALVGVTMLITLLVLPFVGRFTDRLGVKRMAIIGTVLTPLCFIGYSQMQGDFGFFLLLATAILMIGSFTSPLTYGRLIAENFVEARGLALTVMNCTSAVLAILLVPLLNRGIETIGWRNCYLALGAFVLASGLIAILLIPPSKDLIKDTPKSEVDRIPLARQDYELILKSSTFWVIFIGIFLCVLQTPLHAAQMNIMLMDNGLTAQMAANIVPAYAMGTIMGRIICGLALDWFATRIVTVVSMGIPALGYLALGSSYDSLSVITVSMFIVGLSVGAESDLLVYLVARYFKLRIFSTTSGLVFCCAFLGSATGALIISRTLAWYDSFTPFLFLVAGSITIGSLLFLLLPKSDDAEKIG